MTKAGFSSRLTALLGRFRRDSRGNIAVIFALAALPVLSAIGCAIDYSEATRIKAKMQSAADAAAVASISKNSSGWLAASLMTTNGEVSVAETDATNIFNGNINASSTLFNNKTVTPLVTKTGPTLTSTVTFSADVPVTFMQVVGFKKLTVSGSSKATSSLPLYLDFYVALDVSGSMGLPSTASEAQRMQWASPDNFVDYPTGCTLACHFSPQNSACVNPTSPPKTNQGQSGYPTNGYCLGYMISRVSQSGFQSLLQAQSPAGTYPYKNLNQNFPSTLGKSQQLSPTLVSGLPNSLYAKLPPVASCPTEGTDACIQLRLDAVGIALNATQAANGVSGLFETAVNPQNYSVPNQFRIGLYPFIQYMNTNYFPLTSTINGSPNTPGTINYAAANLATLLDTNTDTNLGSGGTHIDQALHDLNGAIKTVGNGSSTTNTLPYVFLITDGAQDPQTKIVPNGGWSGSNHATVLSDSANVTYPAACSDLKSRGIIVSVLNIPYQTISPVNASFAGDEDDFANANIPSIEPSLQTCASPPDAQGNSYYYKATSPAQITAALNAMFNHALVTAHVTN
jgi:Flp pilus assembly protein TadG